MKIMRLGVACLFIAGLLNADTTWNPAANGIYPPSTGNWTVAGNWTDGIPDSADKASFTVNNAAECQITGAAEAYYVALNANGSVLRIKSGGTFTTGNNWSAIGYSQASNRVIVEAGGTATFNNHLWIGFSSTAIGTLDVDGGTVNVTGQLGLAWDGGSSAGYVNIKNGGTLNAATLDGARSISGASLIDIESGSLIINGDKSSEVANYIADGKITGYGGSGTALYDYNASNPGKTTVRAMVGTITPDWQVVSTQHSTNELIIVPFDALADFGIVADGVTDVTDEIQSALIVIGNLGGGALFLPEGFYKVGGNLTVPSGVTLRGDWRMPEAGQPVVGTVLMAYAGRDNTNAAPFIELSDSAGVNGVSIWYPEQLPADIHSYPPTIHGGGVTVENVTFVNAYFGFTSYLDGTTARPFLRGIYGTPLKTGIEFDRLADIGRIETVHFSPDYWADSGLANAPTAGQHDAWIYNNGTGLIVRRIDWSYSCYVTVEGYSIGLALRPTRLAGETSTPNGQSYGFNLIGCKTGVYIEDSAYAGYQFTRFNIQGVETGVYLGPNADQSTMFHTCSISASNVALQCEGADNTRVLMMSCDIQQGVMQMEHGYLSLINSDFTNTGINQIELGSDVRGASILGNRFAGGAQIANNTGYPVNIDHTPLAVAPLPAYDYKKPLTRYQPAKTNLYVVTAAPYNAQADGVTDDTIAFSNALAAADANGGGTVFVPGGSYRLNGTLTVPPGVELRGIFDTPHSTKIKGSLLNVTSGRNNASGTPFIQLESDSGIKGFTFHYPAQIYNTNDTVNFGMVPYPYLIRGLGADIYAINLSATIPYQLLDLATVRCDRHYIDYIFSTALKTGIHVGSGAVDGQIHNCQFNPSAFTHVSAYYDSIPSGASEGIHQLLWRDATPYLFGHMTNEVLHENFVFGGAKGFHLVSEAGQGPSGYCLGFGVDQCTIAMQIDDVGDGGLSPINSQIVTVNATAGHYLETGASLAKPFRMFSSAGWGSHQYSAVINGGDVELQLFHLAPDGADGVFNVLNSASLLTLGGNLNDSLAAGRQYLTIAPTATAAFAGNIINAGETQMPVSGSNVTVLGNLRVGAPRAGIDTRWTRGGGSSVWNNAANWSGGTVPGGLDRAIIADDSVTGPLIDSNTTASVKSMVVGDLSSTADQVDMTGGSLSVTDGMILGNTVSNSGTFALSGGTVNAGSLAVGLSGAGAVTMTNASLTLSGLFGIAQEAGSTGEVVLSGGTLRAGAIYMTGGGLLNITAGTVIVNGDVTALISNYVGNGWITASGGALTPVVDYNQRNPGKTTITAGASPVTATVWNPGSGSSNWTAHTSWSGGAAPLYQIQNLKVVFNVEGARECLLNTNATVAQLVVGDNGTTNGTFLKLTSGADLLCGLNASGGVNWTAIGYNRPATVTVETGAVFRTAAHLLLGFSGEGNSTLRIDGGLVSIATSINVGNTNDVANGMISIDGGGQLRAGSFSFKNTNGVVDIRNGTVLLAGNQTAAVNGFIAAGLMTAYGGAGTLSVDYNVSNPGYTTVRVTPSYAAWAATFGVDIGSPDNDYDSDLRDNLYEYVLNGDPTDSLNTGVLPTFVKAGSVFEYSHLQRNDDSNLVYRVEITTNLISRVWTNSGAGAVTNVTGGVYDEVIHSIPADVPKSYVRLKISMP